MSSRFREARVSLGAWLVVAVAIVGCRREQRDFTGSPPSATSRMATASGLQPGPAIISDSMANPYADNAWAVSQGQQLFGAMNCSGCHAHGGGAIGPALMDSVWIYGSSPEQIFASIAEGRPNGMPSWKHALTNQEIWQLVAYVRSLSGLESKGARSGRPDGMEVKVPEYQMAPQKPKNSSSGTPY